MATIILQNNKQLYVSRAKAESIWAVMSGEEQGTKAQENFCLQIKDIVLSYLHASDAYIEANKDIVFNQAIRDWRVSNRGVPVRPDSEFDWHFARKWGLWFMGGPTEKAKAIIRNMIR